MVGPGQHVSHQHHHHAHLHVHLHRGQSPHPGQVSSDQRQASGQGTVSCTTIKIITSKIFCSSHPNEL